MKATWHDLNENECYVELVDNRGLDLCFSPLGLITVAKVLSGDVIVINNKEYEKHHFIPLEVIKREEKYAILKRKEEYKDVHYLTVNDCDSSEEADGLVNANSNNKIWE